MRQFTILVAGCGSIGQRHARLLAERKDVDLLLADPAPANLQACAAVASARETFTRYGEALQRKPDGVFICSPNRFHVDMALQAVDAGAGVLLEKPVADTVADARRLLAVDAGARKKIAVGYTGRFDKLLRQIRDRVAAGELGTIAYANASVYTYNTLLCAKTDYREKQDWVLIVDYTHEIDFLRFILGDVIEVATMAGRVGNLAHMANPNVIEMLLRFQCGTLGSIHMDYVRHPEKRTLELVGDKKSLEFYMPKGLLRVYTHGQDDVEEINVPFGRDDLFRDQIANFLGVLDGTQSPLVTLEDGIKALDVAETAITACREKRTVRI